MILAVAQFSIQPLRRENIETALKMMDKAAQRGVDLLVLPELFEFFYFPILPPNRYLADANTRKQCNCKKIDRAEKNALPSPSPFPFSLATSLEKHPYIERFKENVRRLQLAVVFSFFEKYGDSYFNSSVLIDKKGECGKIYRKMHLPNGVGYQEDLYFSAGRKTVVSDLESIEKDEKDDEDENKANDEKLTQEKNQNIKIGMGICWDQWFPEHARAVALKNADMLVYPSAIGSEPSDENLDSREHWQQVMCGHAAANTMVVAAANRVGRETANPILKNSDRLKIDFYGSSFIAGVQGQLLAKLESDEQGIAVAEIDLKRNRKFAKDWAIVEQAGQLWKRNFV